MRLGIWTAPHQKKSNKTFLPNEAAFNGERPGVNSWVDARLTEPRIQCCDIRSRVSCGPNRATCRVSKKRRAGDTLGRGWAFISQYGEPQRDSPKHNGSQTK